MPAPAPSINWDDVIAEKVAAKVLAEIGDQLKVNERFATELDRMMGPLGDGYLFHHILGFGPVGMVVEYRLYRNRIRMEFKGSTGETIGDWTLHT